MTRISINLHSEPTDKTYFYKPGQIMRDTLQGCISSKAHNSMIDAINELEEIPARFTGEEDNAFTYGLEAQLEILGEHLQDIADAFKTAGTEKDIAFVAGKRGAGECFYADDLPLSWLHDPEQPRDAIVYISAMEYKLFGSKTIGLDKAKNFACTAQQLLNLCGQNETLARRCLQEAKGEPISEVHYRIKHEQEAI